MKKEKKTNGISKNPHKQTKTPQNKQKHQNPKTQNQNKPKPTRKHNKKTKPTIINLVVTKTCILKYNKVVHILKPFLLSKDFFFPTLTYSKTNGDADIRTL